MMKNYLPLFLVILLTSSQYGYSQSTFHFTDGSTDWDNTADGGTATGIWTDGALEGTATVDGLTVTVQGSFGGGGAASNFGNPANFEDINEAFFDGFTFSARPGSVSNTGANFTNYSRIDISFSQAVTIDSFVLSDIDAQDFFFLLNSFDYQDRVYIEGWDNGTFGAYGSGTTADYNLGSALSEVTRFGQTHVVATDDNTQVDTGVDGDYPEHHLGFNFQSSFGDNGVTNVSIYYANERDNTSGGQGIQVIGLFGNSFEVTSVIPEPTSIFTAVLGTCMLLSVRRRST